MSEPLSTKDAVDLYENGKHRRYTLLFSVNGGAFAITQLLLAPGSFGWLNLAMVAWGMAIFNTVMTLDIFWFGEKLRDKLGPDVDAFSWKGKIVLFFIGGLLFAAWFLVALGLTFG